MSILGIAMRQSGRLLVLSLACLALFLGCAKKQEAKKAKPPVPVLVAQAAQKDVPTELKAIGNVEPSSSVSIRSMVAGEVTSVNFREGQDVRKGDLLFTIDPSPLEADLKRAEGVLSKDMVEAKNAATNAKRYDDLLEKGMVSRQEHDQAATTIASLNETIRSDKAAIDSIKVQLGYTRIKSPIDGRTGNLNVNAGNIVKANDTPALVVINKIRPIYVTFSVPEKFLPEIQGLMPKGKLKVTACINGDKCPAAQGYLTFIDNSVDLATGSIKLKATFDNADRKLWPGQFVDVTMALGTLNGVTVVPSAAVQSGQQGQFVFVVKQDKTVESRPVKSGLTQEGLTVIEQGVKPGETVVTDGQMKLTPGAVIEVKKGL